MVKICPHCHLKNPDHAQSCARCDADLWRVRAAEPRRQVTSERSYQSQQDVPKKRHTLRNGLIVLVILMIAGGVVGGTQATKDSIDTTPGLGLVLPETEDSGPPVLKWGEAAIAIDGSIMITVSAPVDDTANLSEYEREYLGPGKASVYCLVTVQNAGPDSFTYNQLDFVLTDSSGLLCDVSELAFCSQPELHSGALPVDRSITGAITAVVPAGLTIGFVDYRPDVFGDVSASWGN